MKAFFKHIAAFTIVFLAFTFCKAQSLHQYYKSTYGSTDNCKNYHGILDETFPLEMIICGDTGAYKMKSSSDLYLLTLDSNNGRLEIIEEDYQGRNSGFINLTKSIDGYAGTWNHVESAAQYSFSIYENDVANEASHYITKLSGVIRGRTINITIDHANETIEIQEEYGLQSVYKSRYICNDITCSKMVIQPEGIIGVSSVEISKDKRGEYKMIIMTVDQNREASQLKTVDRVLKKTKAYSDYRSMIVAEFATFEDQNFDEYLNQLQANWIKSTSYNLREIHKVDPTEIVSDRLKHQASSWIDIEVWTEDFISGIQYKQYNWKEEVEATSFAYHIDKSKAVSLHDVWEKDWNLERLHCPIDNVNSTWVAGREGIAKVYFDRIKGIQRETYSYIDLGNYIDGGSWLDRLLDQDKIKD